MPAAHAHDGQTECTGNAAPLQLAAQSTRFDAASDACLQWLRRKYRTCCSKATHLDAWCMQDVQNDVDACNELRWTRFAFPSEPHTPLRTDYNNESAKDWPVRVQLTDIDDEHTERSGDALVQPALGSPREQRARLTVVDVKCGRCDDGVGAKTMRTATDGESCTSSAAGTPTEPASAAADTAGHAQLTLAVPSYTFTLHRVMLVSATSPSPVASLPTCVAAGEASAPRPCYGGYVSGPASGEQLRFVLFPQRHHACDSTGRPQEVSHYVRGTLRLLRDQYDSACVCPDARGAQGHRRAKHEVPASCDAARVSSSSSNIPASLHTANSTDGGMAVGVADNGGQSAAVTMTSSSLRHDVRQWLCEAMQLSVYYHLKCAHETIMMTSSDRSNAEATWWHSTMRGVDSVVVQLWTRRPHTERRHAVHATNVERCKLLEDSVAVTLQGGSPRYASALQTTVNTALHSRPRHTAVTQAPSPPPRRHHHHCEGTQSSSDYADMPAGVTGERDSGNGRAATQSGRRGHRDKYTKQTPLSPVTEAAAHAAREDDAGEDRIVSIVWQGSYNSATQHVLLPRWWRHVTRTKRSKPDTALQPQSWLQLPRATYRATCTLSLGLEHLLHDTLYTLFGRLASDAWLQLPLWRRFELTLRHQAGLVLPLSLQPTPPVANGRAAAATIGGAEGGSWHVAATEGDDSTSSSDAVACRTLDGSEAPCTSDVSQRRPRRWWSLSPPALSVRHAGHAYFWATQSPTWSAHLVRGFSNDYSAMHHARHWYALFSAELRRGPGQPTAVKKRDKTAKRRGKADAATRTEDDGDMKDDTTAACVENAAATAMMETAAKAGHRGDGAGVSRDAVGAREDVCSNDDEAAVQRAWRGGAGDGVSRDSARQSRLMGFVNACFVDTLRAAPRASLGFSFTSDRPRTTVDAFNRLVPRHFECSFSWFIAFQERALRRGEAVPSAAGTLPWMRVSPVETFQHLRCGLTFDL